MARPKGTESVKMIQVIETSQQSDLEQKMIRSYQ